MATSLLFKGDIAALKTIKLFNNAGQDVSGFVKTISTGNSILILDVSKLPAGMYDLKTNNSIRKVIKQ